MGTILGFVTAVLPAVLKMVGWVLDKKKADKEMLDSWYTFLKMADKKGMMKVANLLSSEESLDTLKERIRKRQENGQNQTGDVDPSN